MKKTILALALALTAFITNAQSQLSTAFCGYTAKSFGEIIYCDAVPGVNQYRFQFVNAATSYTQVWTNPGNCPCTALYAVPGTTLGLTYAVSVATSTDNGVTWSGYGTPCNLTAPANYEVYLDGSNCGITASTWNQYITCYAGGDIDVTNYKFRLTNAALGYNQTVTKIYNFFALNQFTGLTPATTYTVEVSSDYPTVWQTFGPACTITTPAAPTTSLQASYCGTTMPNWTSYAYAHLALGDSIKFKLSNSSLSYSQTLTKGTPYFFFALNSFTGLQNSTTYTVECALKYNGNWGPYGQACSVTTPAAPTVSIQSTYCGTTPSSYTSLIYLDYFAASSYDFKLENASLSYTQVVNKPNTNVSLNLFTGLTNNTTYTISARVFYNGSWGPYGNTCTITTPSAPTISLQSQYCGTTPASFSTLMYLDYFAAPQYDIKLENSSLGYSQVLNKPNTNLSFNQFTGLQVSTTYTVSARVFYNGVWGPYGNSCTITTPSTSSRIIKDMNGNIYDSEIKDLTAGFYIINEDGVYRKIIKE